MSKQPTEEKEEQGKRAEPNVDEAIEFYSKKWGVTKEEAAQKIQKLLVNRKMPTMEELFPGPIGEVSRKVEDINRATLSTALTRKRIEAIENPEPATSRVKESIDNAVEEVGTTIIKEKLTGKDPIRDAVDKALGDFVGETIKDRLTGTSPEKIAAAIDAKFDEFNEKIMKPIYEEIKTLKEPPPPPPGQPPTQAPSHEYTLEEAADRIVQAEEDARKLLERRGFKITSEALDHDAVAKMIRDAKETWEKENGATVTLETERIHATENILNGVVENVFKTFLGPLRSKIEEAIDRGTLRPPTAAH